MFLIFKRIILIFISNSRYIRNKLLINFLKGRGNDLATVITSVICIAVLLNDSCLMQRYNFFDRMNKMGEKFIPPIAKITDS